MKSQAIQERKKERTRWKASDAGMLAREARDGAVSSLPKARAGTSPDPRVPSSYPRRILLAVTGLSPQVVTETLYALAVRANARFMPTEVHLVTTAEGKERARLSLLSDDPGWFHRLLRDYQLDPIAFDENKIRVLTAADGRPLEDIRSVADNERAADLITETVRELTADPSAALHVSIAGGRKTMGFYLGYALSLFGREQDRLSHVLVSEPYESSWDFFYPTPYSRILATRDNKLADTKDAQVTLADIPFVRLRDGQPRRLLEGQASFSAVVAAASRATAAPRLVLEPARTRVWADDEPITVTATEFALLYWLVERVRRGAPVVDWSRPEAADEFLAVARKVFNEMGGHYERLESAVGKRRNLAIKLAKYFEPHKSRLNAAFEATLGARAAKRYQIERLVERDGKNMFVRFRLPLAPEQIEIRS